MIRLLKQGLRISYIKLLQWDLWAYTFQNTTNTSHTTNRHSKHWIFRTKVSALKEHGILAKFYERIKWDTDYHVWRSSISPMITDAHHTRSFAQWYRQRRSTTSQCSFANQSSNTLTIRFPKFYLTDDSRHSQHCIFRATVSATRKHNIWAKLCVRIKYDTDHQVSRKLISMMITDTENTTSFAQQHWSCRSTASERNFPGKSAEILIIKFIHILPPLWSQTLTTLNLSGNSVGDVGAQYLAVALRVNQVWYWLSGFSKLYFIDDSRHSQHCTFRAIVSAMRERNIWATR